jgi:hypothetical protein
MNTLNGYSKSTLTDKYVLTAAGGHLAVGNANGNIPLNNGTLNTNLNAALLEGKNADFFLRRGRMTNPSDGTNWHGAIPFILALKAAGKPLFDDVEFSSGTNNVKEYNNMQNGAVTVERIVDD